MKKPITEADEEENVLDILKSLAYESSEEAIRNASHEDTRL